MRFPRLWRVFRVDFGFDSFVLPINGRLAGPKLTSRFRIGMHFEEFNLAQTSLRNLESFGEFLLGVKVSQIWETFLSLSLRLLLILFGLFCQNRFHFQCDEPSQIRNQISSIVLTFTHPNFGINETVKIFLLRFERDVMFLANRMSMVSVDQDVPKRSKGRYSRPVKWRLPIRPLHPH